MCCCYQCTERERGKEGEEPLRGANWAGLSLLSHLPAQPARPERRQRASVDFQPSYTIISLFFYWLGFFFFLVPIDCSEKPEEEGD